MDSATQVTLRDQLQDRRRRLERAVADVGEASDLVRLLQEVDSALKRMDGGLYGRCEVCREDVGDDFLLANPAVQYCLCQLTPEQQRVLQSDLDLASRVQWSLLPKEDLTHAGWDAHFRYEPAGAVSGDYCDLLPQETDGGSLLFVVGDVSGKGFAASFVMAHLNAMFRSLGEIGLPAGELVERANHLLLDNRISSHYATLVCGRAERSGEVEMCNAGHCPPLVLRADGVEEVEATGLPVGLFGGRSYTVSRETLGPGDTLLLYTDGLTEACDRGGAEYGAERLASFLLDRRSLSPRKLAASVLEDLSSFRAGAARTDDLTLLVLRRT